MSHERLDGILARRVPPGFPLRRASDRWNRRIADVHERIVCASDYAAEEFRRVGAEVVTVPLGVDLEVFAPGPGASASPPLVVWVGRLSSEKRPELAVETFAALHRRGLRCRFVVVGDGPLRRRVQRRSRGLPVTFTGHLPRDGVAAVLRSSSVLVSTCPVETFGLSVLEALACGTPAVVPSSGAAPELIGAGAGLAVAPTPGALAGAVVELLDDSEASAAARRRAEGFPWERTVERMLAVHGLGRCGVPC